MKKLIVILGPNGVGKTTAAKAFLNRYTKCAMQENVKRCERDGRDAERIERGMKNTFHFYDDLPYPGIITTELSPEEVAGRIADMINL